MDRVKEYYQLYLKTVSNLISSIGWREGLVALLSIIFGSGYYLVTKGWNQMVEHTAEAVIDTLAPFIFVTLVFIVCKLIQAPVKIYSELKSEAMLHTWKDVSIEQYYFPSHEMIGVGLKIDSNKTIQGANIHGVAKIESIVVGQMRIYQEKLPLQLPFVVYSENRPIVSWDLGYGNISKGSENKIAIAGWNDNKAWFYGKDEQLALEARTEYIITIIMHGQLFLTGHDLLDSIIRYKLKYSQQDNGYMQIIMEFLERIERP